MMQAIWRLTRGARVLLLGVLLTTAGCRQAEGEIPMPVDEQPNKVQDVSRDLQNVASGQAEAEQELLDDIDGFDGTPRPTPLMRELSAATGDAVRGRTLPDAQAQELARLLFVAVTAEQLAPNQIEQLGEDLRTALVAAGGDAAAADRAAAAATELQSTITLNRRRWYHFF